METLEQMFYQEGYNQAAAKFEEENQNNLKQAAVTLHNQGVNIALT